MFHPIKHTRYICSGLKIALPKEPHVSINCQILCHSQFPFYQYDEIPLRLYMSLLYILSIRSLYIQREISIHLQNNPSENLIYVSTLCICRQVVLCISSIFQYYNHFNRHSEKSTAKISIPSAIYALSVTKATAFYGRWLSSIFWR